jgi:hypothetical protein
MKSRFRIRNKENNGWYVVSSMDLREKHKQLFMALNGRVTTFRDVLVLLDAIGISNINDSLNKIQECLDKNEIEYDPIEEPEVKKGWFHRLFK